MDTWQIVVLAVGAVLVPTIAMLQRRANRMRRDNVEAQVARNGWSRVPEDSSLLDRWRGAPFGEGSGHAATNVISGSFRGRPIVAFDYEFDTRFQEGTVREVHSVFALTLPAHLPTLELVREGPAGKVRSILGAADLQTGDENFDQRFRLATADPSYAKAILHPDLRRRILDAGNRAYRFENNTLLTWEFGPLATFALDPTRIEKQFDLLVDIVELLPADVWHLYGRPRL